ncbi:MAG: hypothetical protein Hals2KO_21850 [Halioglobus sp.]
MILAAAMLLIACTDGVDTATSSAAESFVEPPAEASEDIFRARRGRDVALEILQSARAMSDVELFEDAAVSTEVIAASTPQFDLLWTLVLRVESEVFRELVRNRHSLLDYPLSDLRGFEVAELEPDYALDAVLRAYQEETVQHLQTLRSEIRRRLYQSLAFYRESNSPAESTFQNLVELGSNGQRNTLRYYAAFNPDALAHALDDVAEVVTQIDAGVGIPRVDGLNDPGFWSDYFALEGGRDGVLHLQEMLARDDILPATAPDTFNRIYLDRVGLNGMCYVENHADWRRHLEALFDQSVGTDVDYIHTAGRQCGAERDAVPATVFRNFSRGEVRSLVLAVGERGVSILWFRDLLVGNISAYDRFFGAEFFEFQGDRGVHLDKGRYEALVEALSVEFE